jgi:hypothetical protein
MKEPNNKPRTVLEQELEFHKAEIATIKRNFGRHATRVRKGTAGDTKNES